MNCLEGKSITPPGKHFSLLFLQQATIPHPCLGPLKGAMSARQATPKASASRNIEKQGNQVQSWVGNVCGNITLEVITIPAVTLRQMYTNYDVTCIHKRLCTKTGPVCRTRPGGPRTPPQPIANLDSVFVETHTFLLLQKLGGA